LRYLKKSVRTSRTGYLRSGRSAMVRSLNGLRDRGRGKAQMRLNRDIANNMPSLNSKIYRIRISLWSRE
jgi:ABC-type proline/glycine betaine transport system ATPase subunit